MPYVHHMRSSSDHVVATHAEQRFSTGGLVTHWNWSVNLPRYVEHVYSWRTGKFNPGDPAIALPQIGQYGIRQPSESGSLVERLADRKRYYEEVMRSAFPAELTSGALSTDKTSATDSGHLFSITKVMRFPIETEFDYSTYDPATPSWDYTRVDGRSFVAANNWLSPRVQNHSWMTYPLEVSLGSLTTAVQRQGTANAFFSNTAPERPTAHLLTTVVELLRGDIPSLLKNYHRALFNYQSKTRALQYAGSEYLNIQFGWWPLINEYANMLKVLIGLDRMVYSESNRRQRSWDGPSNVTFTGDMANRPWTNAPLTGGGEKFQYLTGASHYFTPVVYNTRSKSLVREDYKFSSRYSSLVKATSASTGFVERAEEVLRQLGLVDDPTLLWELTPYSWLVDWVANIGNSISNAHTLSPISGRHSVDYAYFTTQLTSVEEDEVRSVSTPIAAWRTRNHRFIRPKGYWSTVQRVRDRATPFGFGTQLGSLSAPQFAILVALGLARSR